MTAPVPLQFLVGLTRLIAIYFGLSNLDTAILLVINYTGQTSMAPEIASTMPNVWAIYLPIIAFYLALTILVWFAAPAICRLSMGPPASPENEVPSHSVCWNQVMIFLVGTLFLGWGLARLADFVAQLLRARARNLPGAFSNADTVQMLTTLIIMGLGALMMARFPSLYRWLQKRSQEPV